MGDFYLLDQTELCVEFSTDPGFNAQFNPTDKVVLEFGIILSLMLIVLQHIDLNLYLILGFRLGIDLNQNFCDRVKLGFGTKV